MAYLGLLHFLYSAPNWLHFSLCNIHFSAFLYLWGKACQIPLQKEYTSVTPQIGVLDYLSIGTFFCSYLSCSICKTLPGFFKKTHLLCGRKQKLFDICKSPKSRTSTINYLIFVMDRIRLFFFPNKRYQIKDAVEKTICKIITHLRLEKEMPFSLEIFFMVFFLLTYLHVDALIITFSDYHL